MISDSNSIRGLWLLIFIFWIQIKQRGSVCSNTIHSSLYDMIYSEKKLSREKKMKNDVKIDKIWKITSFTVLLKNMDYKYFDYLIFLIYSYWL